MADDWIPVCHAILTDCPLAQAVAYIQVAVRWLTPASACTFASGLPQDLLHHSGHYHHVPHLHVASHCSNGADEDRLGGNVWSDMAENFPFRVTVASFTVRAEFISHLPFRVHKILVRCGIVKG